MAKKNVAKNYTQVLNKYKEAPESVQWYFGSFPALVPALMIIDKKHYWDMIIAYLFMRIEQAQHKTLYSAMVKIYKVDKDLADKALDDFYMTRPKFLKLYKTLAEKPINRKVFKAGRSAEKIRDKIMHGKKVDEVDKRNAVVAIFKYAKLFNKQTKIDFGFEPFGRMKGFNGRGGSHDRVTSEWMLKGMGVAPSEEDKNREEEIAKALET